MDCAVIVDCNTKHTIIRVPHELAVKMICDLGNEELIHKLEIGATRSTFLRDCIKTYKEDNR